MPVKINSRSLCMCILVAIVVPAGICLLRWGGRRPRRVHRERAKTITKEFEYLTRRIDLWLLSRTDTILDRAIELINLKNNSLHL